jgi:hypothetical protein
MAHPGVLGARVEVAHAQLLASLQQLCGLERCGAVAERLSVPTVRNAKDPAATAAAHAEALALLAEALVARSEPASVKTRKAS